MAYIYDDCKKNYQSFIVVSISIVLIGAVCAWWGANPFFEISLIIVWVFLGIISSLKKPIIHRCSACGAAVESRLVEVCPACGDNFYSESVEHIKRLVSRSDETGKNSCVASNVPDRAAGVSAELKKIEAKRPSSQLSKPEKLIERPLGGDTKAVSREVVNYRWVKNIYANGDTTMSDTKTGRMWLCNANPCGAKRWVGAVAYCNNLNYAGYSDWRLPDEDELAEQFSQRGFFDGVQCHLYWSGTSYASNPVGARRVGMGGGGVNYDDKTNDYYVWPVRGGQ